MHPTTSQVNYSYLRSQDSGHYSPRHHNPTRRMHSITKARIALSVALAILMLAAGLELASISSMVYWLHYRAGQDFTIAYQDSTFSLHGKPENLLVDQGHTSNGAAGTAFVLVSLLGFVALTLRSRRYPGSFSRFLYSFWLAMTVLSALLSIAALVYTFVITYQHDGQSIDVSLASTLDNHPYPDYHAYPLESWTPENWFAAVLRLGLAEQSERSDIELHLVVMKVWKWNLIPLAVLGVIVVALAFVEKNARERRERRVLMGVGREQKRVSV
ncbi:hypothetical protein KC343_g17202 [Hortaea werneckii]|uniref:Uncharacterized protein n=1 Tax=Hortaea werneckii TaxID=91943 RepID=A0A3M7F1L1_HORWE|nr:hypothetical protein KC323_g6688 [Hortaea werneckii]KAI7117501.1 hypothetical protein KC352_g33784 [Hortaea werneckii]KAI7348503.1 hypothetical protein KC320_g6604 [Hortaea werneckii]KAI7540061.1 hypothetical protein KC317_g17298 [Hortaea werneckii]KAI7587801.1 hypothetical protein KC346_g17159 [Hortaea werneckii]